MTRRHGSRDRRRLRARDLTVRRRQIKRGERQAFRRSLPVLITGKED